MKKTIFIFGAAALLAFASCKKETTEETEVITTETPADDQDAMQQDVETTTTTTTTTADTVASDGTSVKVNSSGVDVNSQDGNNKTTVKVSEEGGTLEIKK